MLLVLKYMLSHICVEFFVYNYYSLGACKYKNMLIILCQIL